MPSTYANLLFHIIFSTKDRQPFINKEFRDELHPHIGDIILDLGGKPIEIGGVEDHVHILAKLPATLSIADVLRVIKANSSKGAGERPDLVKMFAWQTGYAAFTVSKSQSEAVRKYIRNQEARQRKKSFKEEIVILLDKNEIEYDERYLWD